MAEPSIVTLDIETAPNLADVWQFFKANVGLNQLQKDGYIMSCAYKFLDEDYVYYIENRTGGNDKATIEAMVEVLDRADFVVGHFASKFDVPWILGQAAIHGIKPPSPFKVIDTRNEIKKAFFFPSYKLEYLARVFGCAEKDAHKAFPGHELWAECLKGNDKAWKEMEEYNIQDVETTEELYLKTRAFYKGHPNFGVYAEGDRPVCPTCGSEHIHFRGYAYSSISKFRRFQCQECGDWGRLPQNEYDKEKRKVLARPVR